MRKFLLTLISSLMCIVSFSQNVVNVDGIRYILEDNNALIGRQNKELSGSITIPESITVDGQNYSVTGFVEPTNLTEWSSNEVTTEGGAFQSCNITSITLPNSIKNIGAGAFNSCTNLVSVQLPKELKTLGAASFAGCTNLTSIQIPESVTDFGSSSQYGFVSYVFGGCSNLRSVNIPSGVSELPAGCFMNCGLDSIVLPSSIKSLGDNSLYTNTLKYVKSYIKDISKISYSSVTFSDVSNTKLYVPKGSLAVYSNYEPWSNFMAIYEFGEFGEIITPDQQTVNINGLKYLLKDGNAIVARQNSDLSGDIIIPSNVTFEGTNYPVTSIIEPIDITCYSSNRVECKGGAFEGTQITSITIPNSIDNISAGAFQNCYKLKKVVLPENLKIISEAAFADCSSLSDINIPSNVTDFGSNSAYGYDSYAFGGCTSLKSITIPSGVTRLASGCFKGAGLTELTIPSTIQAIEEGSIDCPYLSTLKLCIKDMDQLSYTESSFGEVSDIDLIVPKGSKQIYQEFYPWMSFKSISEYDDGTEPFVPSYTIAHENGIRYLIKDGIAILARQDKELQGDILIPETINYNGESYTVQDIAKPTNTTAWSSNRVSTENGAFQDCQIRSIELPNSIKTLPAGMFYNCRNLESVILPQGLTRLGAGSFANCVNLKEIRIPETVTDFGSYTQYGYKSYVFGNCSNLKKINVPKGINQFSDGCFMGSGIETFLIPENIKTLNESSFNVNNLKAIKICHKDFKDLQYTESTFGNVSNIVLYVPEGSKQLYEEFYPWKNFKEIKEYDDQYDSILYNAYKVSYKIPSMTANAKSSVASNKSNEDYATDYIASGIDFEAIEAPQIEGYEFKGWRDVPSVMPAKDIVLEAIYDSATGIEKVMGSKEGASLVAIYSINGEKQSLDQDDLPSGMYIFKMSDGTTKKFIKK